MKKVALIFASLVLSVMIQAKTVKTKTVNVVTPGTLSTLVSVSDSVTNLILTGTIDSTDCKYIADSLFESSNFNFKGADTLDLSNVTFVDNEIKNMSFMTTRIKHILFPNTLVHIGFAAFRTNFFETITFPKSVKVIESAALNSSNNLKSIYLLSETVVYTTDSILGLRKIDTNNIKLNVPFNLVDLYKNHKIWKSFKNIVGIVSTDNSTTIINKDTTSTIKLNGDWEVESSASFVTFDKTSGTSDSLLTIKIAENTTDSTRTAYVSIIVDDTTTLKSVKTITLTITQSGKVISVSNEVKTNKLNVYPNPCTTTFNVNVEKESTIEVYSITGSLVLKTIANNNESIDVSDLTTGSYIVKVDNESKMLIKK